MVTCYQFYAECTELCMLMLNLRCQSSVDISELKNQHVLQFVSIPERLDHNQTCIIFNTSSGISLMSIIM